MQQARPRVLAGAERLERPVRWVHTGEISDIAQFLRGGEVLLTAATGLGSSETDRRRYVRELAEVGTSAVFIELGRKFAVIPDDMIREAETRGLVLVELATEISFMAVMQTVHTSIVETKHEMLLRAAEIGDAVSELVLDGAPLSEIVHTLAERLSNPVVLEDASRHVVGFGRSSSPVLPLIQHWKAHFGGHGHDRDSRPTSVHLSEASPPCAWCNIPLRGEVWGRLHVLEVDSPLDDACLLALGRAASAIALHLLADRNAVHLSEAAEWALIHNLAQGRDFSGEEFLGRAGGLGVDFGGELIMLVFALPESGTSAESPAFAQPLVPALRNAMRTARWPSLVASLEGLVVAVASTDPPDGVRATLSGVVELLRGMGDPIDHIGVSRPTKVSLLPRAFLEAEAAHRLGPATEAGPVHHYDELVLYRLLAPLVQGPELANFVNGEIGELVAHDERHGTGLLATLDAYLQSNGNKAATAQAIHLQRRSVYNRLARIEKLIGHAIDSPSHRARLYLALRAREVLEARPGVPGKPGAP